MGNNQNQPIRRYNKQFMELLQAVVEKRALFRDFFVGGTIEALDGVQHNETAFSVKTSDIPVVVSEYNTDPNVGMGTGTANSSRFGEITEIIYEDEDVPYRWVWNFHEGIDRATVNQDFNVAIADRLALQAEARVEKFNQEHSWFISQSASEAFDLEVYNDDAVNKLFNDMRKHFVNNKVRNNLTRVAKVSPDLYAYLVDNKLATTAKHSSANVDTGEIYQYKGFLLEEFAETDFQEGDIAYAYATGIAKAFTGINTARTIESHDFDGVQLQGHGKAGEYIPEQNKIAVVKATFDGSDGDAGGGGVEG